jgi:protein TonB
MLTRDRQPQRRTQNLASLAVVIALHLLLGWALLQVQAVRGAIAEVMPIFVSQIEAEQPKPPELPPPQPPKIKPKEPPPILTTRSEPKPEPEQFVAPPPPPEPEPQPPAPVEAPVVAAAPPAPTEPPAPQPRLITDVAYARPLSLDYPALSRRLNETGLVIVRVLIDLTGRPAQVLVQKTSGYERLDNAAVAAANGALFRPYTENGVPAPAYALIPIRFELN